MMTESNRKKFLLKYCNYCGNKIQTELIEQYINNIAQKIFCDNCGVNLAEENEYQLRRQDKIEPKKGFFKNKSKNDNRSTEKANNEANEPRAPLKKYYAAYQQTPRQMRSVMEIINDPDFPQIFKENLSVAIARVIFIVIDRGDSTINELARGLYEHCFTPKKIMNEQFYSILHKMTREEFEEYYVKLKAKLQGSKKYKRHFMHFLRGLIGIAYDIITKRIKPADFSKFERILYEGIDKYVKQIQKKEGEKDKRSETKKKPIITRKFALLPVHTRKAKNILDMDKKSIYSEMTKLFVKLRSLKNIYVQILMDYLRQGRDISEFSSSSIKAYQNLYLKLGCNTMDSPEYDDTYSFKERTKRCAFFEAFQAVRNYLIKSENLKKVARYLEDLLNSDPKNLVTFLSEKGFNGNALKALRTNHRNNCFGERQYLSIQYLNEHIAYFRNLFLSNADIKASELLNGTFTPANLSVCLKEHFFSLEIDSPQVEEFLNKIIRKFTRKKKRRIVPMLSTDLPSYFLTRYFATISRICSRIAREILNYRKDLNNFQDVNKICLIQSRLEEKESYIKSLIGEVDINSLSRFKQELKSKLGEKKDYFLEQASKITIAELKAHFKSAFSSEIQELLANPNTLLLKRIFKPQFSKIKIKQPSFDSFIEYFVMKLRYKVRECLSELFLTNSLVDVSKSIITSIFKDIHSVIKPPEFKSFSIKIIDPEIFNIDYENLEFELGFTPRVFTKFGIKDKLKRLPQLFKKGFSPAYPTITLKNRKLILNLPLEFQKGEDSKRSLKIKDQNIEIGVDLGLKHFAVVSVWDKGINSEIARYFLGQKELIDKKFDSRTGKFVYRDRFRNSSCNQLSNYKLKLINLRNQIKQLQRKKNNYEQRLLESKLPITNFRSKFKWNQVRKNMSLCWEKYSKMNLELVHMVNHFVIEIARFYGASKVKMEDLKWSKHSKKKDMGYFLANWQVSWFFAQVQAAIETRCTIHGIEFQRVPASHTSKTCSLCGERGTRIGKRFICKCGLELDSDLNAARNIVKYQKSTA